MQQKVPQQNLVERILAKTVGLEMSAEEMALVAGGRLSPCQQYPDVYMTHTIDGDYCDD